MSSWLHRCRVRCRTGPRGPSSDRRTAVLEGDPRFRSADVLRVGRHVRRAGGRYRRGRSAWRSGANLEGDSDATPVVIEAAAAQEQYDEHDDEQGIGVHMSTPVGPGENPPALTVWGMDVAASVRLRTWAEIAAARFLTELVQARPPTHTPVHLSVAVPRG